MKLNQEHKQQIVNELIAATFETQEKELKEAGFNLADELYVNLHGAENLALMDKLPDGYLQKEAAISFRLKDGRYGYIGLKNAERMADKFARTNMIQHEHPMYDKLAIHLDLLEDLDSTKHQARTQARAVVNKATTLKRLLEMWPEIEPFTRNIAPKIQNLPAVQVSELNKIFNLPKD